MDAGANTRILPGGHDDGRMAGSLTGQLGDPRAPLQEVIVEKINLGAKFGLFEEFWSPRVVGELNGQYVKLAKLKGEFVWHSHDTEDELFLVIRGSLVIKLRDGDLDLGEGELCIVPRGVEHCPVAPEEVHVLLFEPKSTLHTGGVKSDLAQEDVLWV